MKSKAEVLWLKASVIGSLWASVEIILGSFFHNLQLPFAGTLLALFTVIFIIASQQLWSETGIIWRAGLICAIMKSISPSAVILGPMTGIFFEAIVLELFIFIFGRNLLGYMIAGSIAVLSALAHKLFTLLLIYGWDSVKILANLYRYAMRQIRVESINPMDALFILIAGYLILGIFGAVTGYYIGKKAKSEKSISKIKIRSTSLNSDFFYNLKESQKYSLWILTINLLYIVSALFILNNYNLMLGFVATLIYIGFHALRYKNSFRQFKRPFLWIQLFLLIILSIFFHSGSEPDSSSGFAGLMMGINMSLRAIIVILGFSAISVELRNPLVKTLLHKRGFSQLYNSLGLAFSALPSILDNVSKPQNIFKKPFKTVSEILLHADHLLNIFKDQPNE